MQSKGEVSPSHSYSKSETKLSSAAAAAQRKSRAVRQERLSKIFNHSKDQINSETPAQQEHNQRNDSKKRRGSKNVTIVLDEQQDRGLRSQKQSYCKQQNDTYYIKTTQQRFSLNDVQGTKMASSHSKLNNNGSSEKIYGTGQLSTYFQNKIKNNNVSSQSFKKIQNFNRNNEKQFNNTHDPNKMSKAMKSAQHTPAEMNVNTLKTSFLNQAAHAKQAQKYLRLGRKDDLSSRNLGIAGGPSGSKGHKGSQNYSINSRINNPRPLNNLAKNLLQSSKNQIDDEEFDQVSMSSFEDRPKLPSTTKNNHRGTKKIQFDEIMKGINMEKSESPIKQSLRNTKMIKEAQGSKTFVATTNAANMIVKKTPQTTKNQTKITTISFNTNQNTSYISKNQRNEEKSVKHQIKSKLLQHTRTGVQSPKITSATFVDRPSGPFKQSTQQSPTMRDKQVKGQTSSIANNYKRGYTTKSKALIQKKNDSNIKSVTLVSNQKQQVNNMKNKSTVIQQDESSQDIQPAARRNAGSIQPSKHDFTNKYINNYFSKSSVNNKKKQIEENLDDEEGSFARHPQAEEQESKVKQKTNYITQKSINQSYATTQANKSNSFLLHSRSMHALQQQLHQDSSIQNEEASVELQGLNASNVFSKHNKQTEKMNTIQNDQDTPQVTKTSKSYHNIKSMYESQGQKDTGAKKKIQHYLKNTMVMRNIKQNQTFHHNIKQDQKPSKSGGQIIGGISFRDPGQYNYSMIENKNDQMNTARNTNNHNYNDLGKQFQSAKNYSHAKSIKNINSDSKRSEDYEKAPSDQNNQLIKNRQFSAKMNKSKDFQQSIKMKYMSNNKPIIEDQEEQNGVTSDFKPYDSSGKKYSGEKDPVESSVFDHKSPMKETDIIAELKGDSPLEDSRHIKRDNTEKAQMKKYASITSAKSSKKNEITIKIENTKEPSKKDELKKNQSNKTISIEKSEITKCSPHSKNIENTIKKASSITQNIAKTSISNPVNRLSSLSGQKQINATGENSRRNTPDYPLSSETAKKHFKLTDFEMQEINEFDRRVYYAGQKCNTKVKGHPIKYVTVANNEKSQSFLEQNRKSIHRSNSKSNNIDNSSSNPKQIPSTRQKDRLESMNIFNYGYDDDQGDYKTQLNDHLGYRFQVIKSLGSGSFGQALECLDHKTNEMVAVKIIRNQKKFQYQAGMELKILKYLNYNDKNDQNNIIRVKDYLIFREHLIISFELLSINLYEFIKKNDFRGVTQNLIRRFAIQILQALKFQQSLNLVHCDLKPENILLKQERKSGIKMIDYGSSCFLGQRIYTYIQSRFYRAPEIILGIPYTTAIDMWSFGAIIAELYTGYPLFPGEDEVEQLAYIMEIYGVPSKEIIKMSSRGHLFFHKTGDPILSANSKGKVRKPCTKSLQQILRCTDENFIDFLNKCFIWNPCERMTPLEALQHPWILEGLPEKVLKSHTKMFGNIDEKQTIKKATFTSIQGFPPDKKDVTIYQMIEEQMKDDAKREAALHRKQNSEIGVLKSDNLLTKKESLRDERSPQKEPFKNFDDETPSNQGNKERKSRKQRLTRISEQNADNMLGSISYASEMREDDAEDDQDNSKDVQVHEMDLMSPINSN